MPGDRSRIDPRPPEIGRRIYPLPSSSRLPTFRQRPKPDRPAPAERVAQNYVAATPCWSHSTSARLVRKPVFLIRRRRSLEGTRPGSARDSRLFPILRRRRPDSASGAAACTDHGRAFHEGSPSPVPAARRDRVSPDFGFRSMIWRSRRICDAGWRPAPGRSSSERRDALVPVHLPRRQQRPSTWPTVGANAAWRCILA